jgi:hypothetical protein
MKTIYFLFLGILFFSTTLQAQVPSIPIDTTIGYHYKVIVELPLYRCNLLGVETDSSMHEAPIGATFTHIGNSGNNVIIRFWKWSDDDVNVIPYNFTDSTKKQKSYFLMNKTDFMMKTKQRYSKRPSLTIGTAAVPFKLRSNPFQFSTDVTLGTVAGVKVRMNPYTDENFYNFLVGFGLSNVNLDSTSTGGNINQNSTVQNTASFTLSAGGVLEFSGVQIGIFVGWDFINNNDKIQWSYHGKPWVSIGLGYSLFTKSKTSTLSDAGYN